VTESTHLARQVDLAGSNAFFRSREASACQVCSAGAESGWHQRLRVYATGATERFFGAVFVSVNFRVWPIVLKNSATQNRLRMRVRCFGNFCRESTFRTLSCTIFPGKLPCQRPARVFQHNRPVAILQSGNSSGKL
jgi:hypothetical protein